MFPMGFYKFQIPKITMNQITAIVSDKFHSARVQFEGGALARNSDRSLEARQLVWIIGI